jgi:hypothetical protein
MPQSREPGDGFLSEPLPEGLRDTQAGVPAEREKIGFGLHYAATRP